MTEQNVLVSKELSAAGVPSEITPELIELDHYRITSDSNLPEEEFMMELFGQKCFPRKDLTTFTGPAKSGKTFWTSILMACCAKAADSERKVLELQRIREEPLKVMWYDTEQSRQTTKNISVLLSYFSGRKQLKSFKKSLWLLFPLYTVKLSY